MIANLQRYCIHTSILINRFYSPIHDSLVRCIETDGAFSEKFAN